MPLPTESEAAFERLLATFDELPEAESPRRVVNAAVGAPTDDDAAAFLAGLYERSASYLERDRFATIGEADAFFTKVVGVTFEGRQDVVAGLRAGEPVDLRRDPGNPHDPNAIEVRFGALQIGYMRREIARRIAPQMDAGVRYAAEIASVTGGGTRSVGVNLAVRRERANIADAPPATRTGGASRVEVLHALIGERPLRDAQRAVIERVDSGRRTLAVLGTGRGKSLCFSYPAAMRAFERGEKTIVLYPLRALANDQFDALLRRLGPLGLRVFRANGSIESAERAHMMDALATGAWDVLCATPEFLTYHLERFRNDRSRPSLLVIDEAHHLAESTHRPAYVQLPAAIAALGDPQVLALTATADDATFAHIVSQLRIDAWVIDPTVRTNLAMVDARGTSNKIAYIATVLKAPGKAIVYCNSRNEATTIAKKLTDTIGGGVAFYHAGVPSADRMEIERLFRSGGIRVVVATSAFGEGIDLPDVRNVFLYHLNFAFTEFNQQSGRAGRDGEPAQIHLLFGEKDRNLNDFILERSAPTLHTLRAIYREMRRLTTDGTVRKSNADIADILTLDKVAAETIGVALRIFADAGLIELGEGDDGREIRFRDVTEKVDLTRNSRFAEGEAEREDFAKFYDVVSQATSDVLEHVVNRPIYPSNVALIR